MDRLKNTARLQRMKNTHTLKKKRIKTGKKIEQRIVCGVKIALIILSHKT